MYKKKKRLPPRHTRMKKNCRLQAAKVWLAEYTGKNIVKGYSKHFAVDKLCAVKELQMIGVQIDPIYIEQLKRSIEGILKAKEAKRRRKQEEEELNRYIDSDENFAYIAGYTPAGFPYGTTWEEWAEMERKEVFRGNANAERNIETDLSKIRQLAEENEEENWEFRSFLKSTDYLTEEIDRVVHKLYQQVSSKVDCTKCGNCCKIVKPILTQEDIEKLSDGLGVTVSRVKKQYLIEGKGEGRFMFKTRQCPFLEGTICTQYSRRPAVCKSFPHLHKKNFISRLINVIENYSICPIVFNVYEGLKEKNR